jgi:CRISPR type III-B/RAMP module-associated protein Cmr5
MKNLDQIRAKNAIQYSSESFLGKNGGDIVKKVPTMIRENGLLGALAFAKENSGSGYEKTFLAIIKHLSDPSIKKSKSKTLDEFIMEIVSSDSVNLRDISIEAMAYLNYLRRFAQGGK